MLINQVIDSKSIALAATENASNAIPYLGTAFFPDEKKAGLDLSWIKTHKGLPVTLAPSNFDALPVIRAREGLKKEKTQMAFFRESMIIKEEDVQEIDRITSADDPYLVSAIRSIYDDTNNLVSGAEVVPERMRMSLLATTNGHPVIGIESDGVSYAYDYDPSGDYATNHYVKMTSSTDKWTDTTNSTPIDDLNAARKSLEKLGRKPKYALMTSTTFGYLAKNKQVKDAILAQNPTANVYMTDALVIDAVKNLTQLTILVYDKMYIDDAGNETQFYPDGKVTLLPEGPVGKTWFGTTPEERTARQVANVDVTIYGKGIAVAVKTEYGPPALTTTTASEIVLPSYEDMDSTYVLEVANP